MTPMVFQRFTFEFKDVDWSMVLDNPFPLTNLIGTMLEEAKAKHMAVFIHAALVPVEWFYGPAPEPDTTPPTPTGENEDGKEGSKPGSE